jgi:hypothetical protein
VRFQAGTIEFHSIQQRQDRLWGPSCLLLKYYPGGPISLEVKMTRREADHLTASSAEIKNCGAILPLPPPFINMMWCLIV